MKIWTAESEQRSYLKVPVWIGLAFILLLALQILVGIQKESPEARIHELPETPPLAYLKVLDFGDPQFLSRFIVLWLQAHDYQQGVSLSYNEINYERLISWLDASVELDSKHDYPLLLASRVYTMVADSERKRLMLEYVAETFAKQPVQRWRFMAHAVYVARHHLKDKNLALEYARLIREETRPGEIPHWARQMHIFILADMGKIEAAKVLLGGLHESGELQDKGEYQYLLKRLNEQEQEQGNQVSN